MPSWTTVTFLQPFSSTPLVFALPTTGGGDPSSVPFMDVGLRNVTPGSFEVPLERAESTAGSVTLPERIAILAIDNLANVSFVDALGSQARPQSLATAANIQIQG